MTPDPPHRFELTTPAEAGYVATIRMFAAAVARSAGADEEVVEDVRLAVSELVTAIVAGGDRDLVHVVANPGETVLELVIRPLLPGDLVDGAIDPVDIVLALFPETTRDLAQSTVHLPIPLEMP